MIDRPHIEFVCADAIAARPLRPPFSASELSARPLVGDISAGNGAAVVEIPPGWRGEAVDAPFELIVLEGGLEVDGELLGQYGYLSAVPEGRVPVLATSRRCLAFVDAIADVSGHRVLPWSPEGFQAAAMAGLSRKIVRGDPGAAHGWFLRIPAGWSMEMTEWHDCAEASFRLEGDLWHVRANNGAGGTMRRHCYFWRPARKLHGPMGSHNGSLSWVYVDGPLASHFVEVEGEPPPEPAA